MIDLRTLLANTATTRRDYYVEQAAFAAEFGHTIDAARYEAGVRGLIEVLNCLLPTFAEEMESNDGMNSMVILVADLLD